MNLNQAQLTWSRAYWAVVVNQVLGIGAVSLLATAMLRESFRACYAAELALPKITLWYFDAVGPMGMLAAGVASLVVSLAVIGLRQRFASVLIATASFSLCILFLAGGMFASIAPLLVAIRAMLPPEQRW
jgi:hypothetical protein